MAPNKNLLKRALLSGGKTEKSRRPGDFSPLICSCRFSVSLSHACRAGKKREEKKGAGTGGGGGGEGGKRRRRLRSNKRISEIKIKSRRPTERADGGERKRKRGGGGVRG